MILKADAKFTSVTDKKTGAVSLDGGLEIAGEIIPDTPLQHELLVAVLGEKDSKNLDIDVSLEVEPVTEKLTFKVRVESSKDILAIAGARLKTREDANNAGLPIHLHEEKVAAKAAADKKAADEAKAAE